MREKWIQWLSDGEVEYTRSGKQKSAYYEMVVHRVSECSKALSNDFIHQPFLSRGITREASVRLHQRLQLILQDEAVNDEDEEASGLTDTEENEEQDEEAEDMEEVDN